MKYEQFSLSVILTVLGRSTSVVYASETGEALAACKKYISELYEGKLRTKVTSIRDRRSGSEIKIRVSTDGEIFNTICHVDRNGELTYSTDHETQATTIVAKDTGEKI